MFKQAVFVAHAPPRAPAPAPVLAGAARKVAGVLIGYARAQRKRARAQAVPRVPVREFGTVVMGGQVLGAVYEDGQLIAVIPDVGRM